MKRDALDVKIPEATFRTGFDRLIRLFFDGAGEHEAKRLSMYVISRFKFYTLLIPFLAHLSDSNAHAPAWSPGFQCHGMIWPTR